MNSNNNSTINKNKKIKKKSHPLKKTLTVIGTTLLSLVLIVIITGSIVATALTVYVMKFMDDSNDIDLNNLELKETSIIYAYDDTGKEVETQRLSRDANRIIVDIADVPEYVKMAFVCVEDERFFEHRGVDFKRTFAAFANLFLHFNSTEYGGSTITQQLVKNITQDDKKDLSRKIREIFRAMNLEKYYTKPDILEAYLNYIGFGGITYGVQAASYKYFGKDISQLTIAEAASLAAIPKDPNNLNPLKDPEANKERQLTVLNAMLKNSVISDQEYDEAKNQQLVFANQTTTADGEQADTTPDIQSYFEDMVIEEVTADMMELYGINYEDAMDKVLSGGYRIYSTENISMQNAVQQKFLDAKTFSAEVQSNPPQAAFICMDYKGNIKAVVGGVGQKPSALCFNRATMSKRSPGSCIKPITTYSYGLSLDLFHWSSIYADTPIQYMNYKTGQMEAWPINYTGKGSNNNFFLFDALLRSLNTVPAQLCELEKPRAVFDFAKNKMGLTTLVEAEKAEDGSILSDVNLSPMTVGGLTQGVTLKELVSAYQVFGDLGKRYDPTSYSKVTDAQGKVILEHKYIATQAIDEDTAYVMNKLMLNVVEDAHGTGKPAKLNNTPLAAKTGTSQDWLDLSFVGCTPDYVSGVWFGYDDQTKYDEKTKKWVPNTIEYKKYYGSAKVWKNIFGDIAETEAGKTFPVNENVEEHYYCTVTGLIAGPNCTTKSATPGYYKPSNVPAVCNGNHEQIAGAAAPTTTTPAVTTTIAAAAN